MFIVASCFSFPGSHLHRLPVEVDVLALEPVVNAGVHLRVVVVLPGRQLALDCVADAVLGNGKVLVAPGILLELLLGEQAGEGGNGIRGRHADHDELVPGVEDLLPAHLPLALLRLQAVEDELGVAVNVIGHALVLEALRDGRLHLADGAVVGRVQVDQGAALAVHDEVAIGLSLLGHLDKVVDCAATGPG